MGTNATTNNTMGAVALPVSMDLSVLSMGTLDIKPIPTKIIKCYVVQDSYVRSSFPNMNYGRDGLVIAGGGSSKAYLRFDLTNEKASIDMRDLVEARLQMYSEATPDPYPIPFYEMPGVIWYENDINWTNAPQVPTPLNQAGSWAQVVERDYSPSSSLKSLVTTTDIINLAFLETDVNHSVRVSSKEGVNPPYIELEVIDRAAMTLSMGTYDASLKFSPTIFTSDYVSIDFNLISKNLVEDFEARLGVTAITQASNYTLSIADYPLEVNVIQKNSWDILAQVGVSTTLSTTSSVLSKTEFPIRFYPALIRKEDYDLRVGVSAPVKTESDVLSTDHFVLAFEPEVNGAFCIRTQVGVSAVPSVTASVLATAEFPMEFDVIQRAELQVPCQLGVSTIPNFVGSILSTFEIPFDMYVPANYYLPFKIDVRAHEHYSMDMNVIPVLMLPFNFEVNSPFFPINIDVVQKEQEYIPFHVIPLIRNVELIPIEVDVRLPATYGFIV